jgi:hypothetical protein
MKTHCAAEAWARQRWYQAGIRSVINKWKAMDSLHKASNRDVDAKEPKKKVYNRAYDEEIKRIEAQPSRKMT